MKSFATALLVAASAAIASAQATYDPTTNTWTCAIANATYCEADTLTSNIIIRCQGTVGTPGNCDDNLAGEPPVGDSFSPCWETSATSGDAACSKNCVVYGSSGSANGTFTIDGCTQSTSSSISYSWTTTYTPPSSTDSVYSTSYPASISAVTTTAVTTAVTSTVTSDAASTLSIWVPIPSSGSSLASQSNPGGPIYPTNSTATYPISSGTATGTPTAPSSTATSSPIATGGAVANKAGSALVAVGVLAAYLL